MPRSAYFSTPPVMVNVLPDPVCPYAKMVALKPSSALLARACRTQLSYAAADSSHCAPQHCLSGHRVEHRLLLRVHVQHAIKLEAVVGARVVHHAAGLANWNVKSNGCIFSIRCEKAGWLCSTHVGEW